MKICYTLIIFVSSILVTLNAQDTIPNGSFERWIVRELYDEPVNWTSSNQLTTMLGYTSASLTSDNYQGNSALRLETIDTIAAFAFSNGTVTEGNVEDGIQFTGGFPISGTPTTLSCFCKYSVPLFLDAAVVLVSFKKNGIIIGQDYTLLPFSQNSYTKVDLDISPMAQIPDTAFIVISSSNPNDPKAGSWIQVDSLWFTGIPDLIPNGNFETWETESYEDPADWLTTNLFSHLFGGNISATRSSDAYSGDYAIRIECIETTIPDDDGAQDAQLGFLLPYTDDANFIDELPAFGIDINPTGLSGYYKFQQVGTDTAMVEATLIGDSDNEYTFTKLLPPTDTYTQFEISFDYPAAEENIEAIRVLANTSKHFDLSLAEQGELGSVLFLDDLELLNTCANWGSDFEITINQWPSCTDSTAILDAGKGWGTYTWSTGETTQSIQAKIDIGNNDTISVIVTATDSWCFYTDEVIFTPLTDCSTNALPVNITEPSISLYPNPITDVLNVELEQFPAGNYLLELFDITGKPIVKENLNIIDNYLFHKIDMDAYSEGLYLLKISSNHNRFLKRIQKN